jgi:transmembrane sensor
LAHAGQHVDAGFGASDVERGLASLQQRIEERRRLKRVGLSAASLAAVSVAAFVWFGRPSNAHTLQTHDGSVATLLQAQTVLGVRRDGSDEVALELEHGKAHFEVAPNPKRRYRVRAGEVEVEVLGTAFEVERLGSGAHVNVERGVVRVSWNGGSATLRAGQDGTFPPRPVPVAPTASAEAVREVAEPALPEAQAKPAPRERWRVLARAGKHQEAFGSLGKEPVEDLAGLLLAADAARLSGHPREAARYLEHLIQRYPESPSAPLAAFTLGRLALYELKQPALAASSFGRAFTLDPKGPLAEDALAREAEAYHRAGDAQRTKSAAERYLARFPKGARREELVRYAAEP